MMCALNTFFLLASLFVFGVHNLVCIFFGTCLSGRVFFPHGGGWVRARDFCCVLSEFVFLLSVRFFFIRVCVCVELSWCLCERILFVMGSECVGFWGGYICLCVGQAGFFYVSLCCVQARLCWCFHGRALPHSHMHSNALTARTPSLALTHNHMHSHALARVPSLTLTRTRMHSHALPHSRSLTYT